MNIKQLRFLDACLEFLKNRYPETTGMTLDANLVFKLEDDIYTATAFQEVDSQLNIKEISYIMSINEQSSAFQYRFRDRIDIDQVIAFLQQKNCYGVLNTADAEMVKIQLFSVISELEIPEFEIKINSEILYNVTNLSKGFSLPFMKFPDDAEFELVSIN